jgi:hypothetical protein
MKEIKRVFNERWLMFTIYKEWEIYKTKFKRVKYDFWFFSIIENIELELVWDIEWIEKFLRKYFKKKKYWYEIKLF